MIQATLDSQDSQGLRVCQEYVGMLAPWDPRDKKVSQAGKVSQVRKVCPGDQVERDDQDGWDRRDSRESLVQRVLLVPRVYQAPVNQASMVLPVNQVSLVLREELVYLDNQGLMDSRETRVLSEDQKEHRDHQD